MAKNDNLTDYLVDLGTSIKNKLNIEQKIKPINFPQIIKNIPNGVICPKIININDDNGILRWELDDISYLEPYEVTISYVITFNNLQFTTQNTFYDLTPYYDESKSNIATIKLKMHLTQPNKQYVNIPVWNYQILENVDVISNNIRDWCLGWDDDNVYKMGSNNANDRYSYANLNTGELTTTSLTISYGGGYNRIVSGGTTITTKDKIFRFGGCGGSGMYIQSVNNYTAFYKNEITQALYGIPTSSNWETSLAVYGDYIYMFGGQEVSMWSSAFGNAIFKIDINTNRMTRLSCVLPGTSSSNYAFAFATATYGDYIYLYGVGDDANPRNAGLNVYRFDPINETLEKMDQKLSQSIQVGSNNRKLSSCLYHGMVYVFTEEYVNSRYYLRIKEINPETFEVKPLELGIYAEGDDLTYRGLADDNPVYCSEKNDCMYVLFNKYIYKISYN